MNPPSHPAPPDLPLDRSLGALLGLAAGDAVGTTVEFRPRGTFEPLTDMVGGGPFRLAPGQWTDDTSMALCLASSLLQQGGFDARDQMERYLRWRDEGYLSSTGTCFDIGSTVASALDRYRQEGNPLAGTTHPRSAGNGSIMRLAPVVLYFMPDQEAAEHYAAESSRTTHGAAECVDAARLLARILAHILGKAPARDVKAAGDREALGDAKEAVLFGEAGSFRGEASIEALARGAWRDKSASSIRGSGYVVDSLEAALWCFARTESYEEAVLLAANLGDDADTTAAVTGQIAGAFYGMSGIPAPWLERLAMREEIVALARGLHGARTLRGPARTWSFQQVQDST